MFWKKYIATIIAILVAFIPLCFFLGMRALLAPQGFWQKFFIYGAGFYFLTGTQLILVCMLAAFLLAIWKD